MPHVLTPPGWSAPTVRRAPADFQQPAAGWRAARAALTVCVALALVACGGGGGGGGDGPAPPAPPGGGAPPAFTAAQLLPLAPGHRWVYRLQDSAGQPMDTLVTSVGSQETVGGQLAWRVTTRSQTDPSTDDDEFYRVDADGIRSVPGPGAEPFEVQLGPALVLRNSFSPGDTWVALDRDLRNTVDLDGDGRLDSLRVRSDVTVQPVATLTTAGGALTGVAHLRSVTTLNITLAAGGPAVTVRIDADDWYAPGIGPVRSRIRASDPDFGASVDIDVLAWSVGAQRSDTVPPALTSVQPADGSTGLTATPAYTFSEPMDRRAMDAGGFTLLDAQGRAVAGSLAWNAQGTGFSFLPVFGLPEGRYSARFGPAATDLIGNPLPTAPFTFTVDRSGPVLLGSTPLPNSSGVAPDAVIELQFSEPLGNLDPLFTLARVDNGEQVTLTGEVQGTQVRLRPPAPLVAGALYRLRSTVDLIDRLGNTGLAVDFSFSVAGGRFGEAQLLPGIQGLSQVQAVDANGDGRADLLAIGSRIDPLAPATSVLLMLQQATGGLGAASTLPVPQGCEPVAVDAGDVDGDGRLDVVFSAFPVGAPECGLGWLRQAADGSFGFAGWVSQTASPRALRLLPRPGQARPTLAVADDGILDLFEPQGASGFAPARGLSRALTDIREMLVSDLDGDGRSDLWLLGRVASGAIGWAVMRQADDGSFALLGDTQELDCRLFSECALALGPAGPGGARDLYVGFTRVDEFGSLSFAAQRLAPEGAGRWTVADTLPVARSPHAMQLADIDGDGRADLVVAHDPLSQLGVTRRRADGGWDGQELFGGFPGSGLPRSLAVADFNGDGLPDIVLGASLRLQTPAAGATPSRVRLPGAGVLGPRVGLSGAVGR